MEFFGQISLTTTVVYAMVLFSTLRDYLYTKVTTAASAVMALLGPKKTSTNVATAKVAIL